jgi:hypothetical protein
VRLDALGLLFSGLAGQISLLILVNDNLTVITFFSTSWGAELVVST